MKDGRDDFDATRLPSADQKWMHSTTTIQMLTNALQDKDISAIETDILMGYALNKKLTIPIAAHPPAIESDLSMEKFFDMAAPRNTSTTSRTLIKHIKLDFKELEAVGKSLEIATSMRISPGGKIVYLNADVLPGPGSREKATIEADAFMQTCLRCIDSQHTKPGLQFAFSLGYRCDYRSESAFVQDDLDQMIAIVNKYNVMKRSAGLVLAINARLMSKNVQPFVDFLRKFPLAQILAWTGSGEPAIPMELIDRIKAHFCAAGIGDSIGFDCNIHSDSP